MKLPDTILLVLAFVFFVIGIHQAIVIGLTESYWIFMFSLMALFLYGYRKNKLNDQQTDGAKDTKGIKTKKRKNG